jgi:hypothetical protein
LHSIFQRISNPQKKQPRKPPSISSLPELRAECTLPAAAIDTRRFFGFFWAEVDDFGQQNPAPH